MNKIMLAFAGVVIFLVSANLSAEVIKDYFAEPGINPFKETLNQSLNEHIDPFNGMLQIKHLDVKIPGNGGLDLNIFRSYSSLQQDSSHRLLGLDGYYSILGVGWNMGFGKVVFNGNALSKANACIGGPDLLATSDNPMLEFPDGSREMLVRGEVGGVEQNYLVTRSRWKAQCITNGVVYDGLLVTSPDGVQYTMNRMVYRMFQSISGNMEETGFYTSKIVDTNGNSANFSFLSDVTTDLGYAYYAGIDTSDQRHVQFVYDDVSGPRKRLKQIQVKKNILDNCSLGNLLNCQVWDYTYADVPDNPGFFQLTKVQIPPHLVDNYVTRMEWAYSYYGTAGTPNTANAGAYSLNTVTYPYGGNISYKYDYQVFNPSPTSVYSPTTVVTEKTLSGANITQGNWTFSYLPASTVGTNILNETVIIPPDKNLKYVYKHIGYNVAYNSSVSDLWKVGLLAEKEIFDTGVSLEKEINTWAPQKISKERYWHGRDLAHQDDATYVPLLVKKEIIRGGFPARSYTTEYPLANYDVYGNPQKQLETTNELTNPAENLRETTYTYYYDSAKWIIKKLKDETITGIGTVARLFDANGNLTHENKYGVTTDYTYTPEGDVKTTTNPREKAQGTATEFSNYYRGISQNEKHPLRVVAGTAQYITTSRVVNHTGTVQSQTDGRGNITSFTYNKLNQLTGIAYPRIDDADVNVVWSTWNGINRQRTLTRGNYQETVTFDGFGKPLSTKRADTALGLSVTSTRKYDALNRTTFESYPNSPAGTTLVYDGLGRIKSKTNPDTTKVTYNYVSGDKTQVTDELFHTTNYRSRSFSDPANAALMQIDTPVSTGNIIQTIISRNKLDLVTKVTQGDGVSAPLERTYAYDARYFLTGVVNPEIGATTLGRDEVGNLTTRKIGTTLLSTSSYDLQNRVERVDYGNVNLNTHFSYDGNSNPVSVEKGVSPTLRKKTFGYDLNNNLTSEIIQTYGNTFSVGYGYNNLDFLTTLTYPSGSRVVTYAPDALGRPTKVTPVLSSVSYHPSGTPNTLVYANGQTTRYTQNARLWVQDIITNGVSNALSLKYGYDNAGNIKTITDNVNAAESRSMKYDDANRLSTASGEWGTTGNIGYDAIGNIKTKTIGSHTLSYVYAANNRLDSVSGSVNQSYQYDVMGNITNNGTAAMTYAPDANLVQAVTGGQTLNYDYDGNNRRVRRDNGTRQQYYVYALGDNLLGEYGADGTWVKEYYYLGRQQVAVAENVPAQVSNVTLTPSGVANSGQYNVNWPAIVGSFTHYEVLESQTLDCSAGTITKTTSSSLFVDKSQVSGNYYYCVRACNYDSCGDYTNSGSGGYCAIGASGGSNFLGKPCAPGYLNDAAKVTTAGASYPVNWGPSYSPTIDFYRLQMSTDPLFNTIDAVMEPPTLTNWNVTNPTTANGYYYFRVMACVASGSGNCSLPRYGNMGPGPASVTVPGNAAGSYTISWDAVVLAPVDRYELYQSTSANFSGAALIYSGLNTSFVVSGNADGTYYYQVRACSNGICGVYVKGNNGVKLAYAPSVPASLIVPTTNEPGTGEFNLSWSASSGAVSHYEIQEAKLGDYGDARWVATFTGTSGRITGKIDGSYYYRIRACNGSTCSGYQFGSYQLPAGLQSIPNPVVVSGSPVLAAVLGIINTLLLN